MTVQQNNNRIAVLDFGGQYAHLIANRIRRLGVYSEIVSNTVTADTLKNYSGIILSGSPGDGSSSDPSHRGALPGRPIAARKMVVSK